MKDLIRLEGVGKRYFRFSGSKFLLRGILGVGAQPKDWFWAVKGVDMAITRPGSSFGIIGSNGSGKTTLLKIIAGVTAPTTGHVSVHGRIISLLELFAGMQGELTGRENIFMNGLLLGMRRQEIRRKLDSIVQFAGIGEFLDMPFKHYSLGMQMRLGFSLSTHVEASAFLVDEAWGIGDSEFQAKSFERLQELNRNGAVLILVSHDALVLRELVDQTLWLERGEVKALGPTEEVIAAYMRQVENHPKH